jgi:hypothetical protein
MLWRGYQSEKEVVVKTKKAKTAHENDRERRNSAGSVHGSPQIGG